MRALKLWLSLISAGLLCGCAGYHLGPVNGAEAGDKSIEIAPFNNQTLEPRLGDVVTQSLRECLQKDSTYRLATHGQPDILLTGVILSYGRQAIGFSSTDAATAQDFQVNVVARVTARDVTSGKILLDKEVHGHTLVHVDSDLASAERQAMPNLGADLSQNITELLTEGSW